MSGNTHNRVIEVRCAACNRLTSEHCCEFMCLMHPECRCDACAKRAIERVADLTAERDAETRRADDNATAYETARAERDALRVVFDAAWRCREAWRTAHAASMMDMLSLTRAVDAILNAKDGTSPADPHACPVSGEGCICDDKGRASCRERVSITPVSDRDAMRVTIAQLVRLIEDVDRAEPGLMPVARAAIAARRAKRRWLDTKDGPR